MLSGASTVNPRGPFTPAGESYFDHLLEALDGNAAAAAGDSYGVSRVPSLWGSMSGSGVRAFSANGPSRGSSRAGRSSPNDSTESDDVSVEALARYRLGIRAMFSGGYKRDVEELEQIEERISEIQALLLDSSQNRLDLEEELAMLNRSRTNLLSIHARSEKGSRGSSGFGSVLALPTTVALMLLGANEAYAITAANVDAITAANSGNIVNIEEEAVGAEDGSAEFEPDLDPYEAVWGAMPSSGAVELGIAIPYK